MHHTKEESSISTGACAAWYFPLILQSLLSALPLICLPGTTLQPMRPLCALTVLLTLLNLAMSTLAYEDSPFYVIDCHPAANGYPEQVNKVSKDQCPSDKDTGETRVSQMFLRYCACYY